LNSGPCAFCNSSTWATLPAHFQMFWRPSWVIITEQIPVLTITLLSFSLLGVFTSIPWKKWSYHPTIVCVCVCVCKKWQVVFTILIWKCNSSFLHNKCLFHATVFKVRRIYYIQGCEKLNLPSYCSHSFPEFPFP
jgi:hypothetical protein